MRGDPRGTQAWRKLRAEILEQADTCARCGTWIDDDLPARHPHKATVDHLAPVATHAHLAFDRTLLRPVCGRCNASTGASLGNRLRGQSRARRASRDW